MVRTEVCLEAATRATAGLVVALLGHFAGTIVSGLLPSIGIVVYLLGVGPAVVVGFYLVATGAWVVVEQATSVAIERAEAVPDTSTPPAELSESYDEGEAADERDGVEGARTAAADEE